MASDRLTRLITSYPVRLTAYGITAFAIFQLVVSLLESHGANWLGAENGPLEMSQVVLATFTAISFAFAATKSKAGRAGLVGCAVMVAYAAAREADMIFESLLFEDAYKYVVGIPVLLIGLTTFVIYRKSIVADALWLVRQPAVTMFAIAGIYLCAMTQILDRPIVWSEVPVATQEAKDGLMATKGVVEESAELFAYLLLAFSGVEALILSLYLKDAAAELADESATVLELPSAGSSHSKAA